MFNDKYYVDTSVPFKYRHRSVSMQRVTDAFRFIMHTWGFYIFNYIDDLIGCDDPITALLFRNRVLTKLRMAPDKGTISLDSEFQKDIIAS